MYDLPHELPNKLENEKILVIKLAIKLSMKDGIHPPNSRITPKASQSTLWRIVGPTTDLKTHKKVVYDNVTNHVAIKSFP